MTGPSDEPRLSGDVGVGTYRPSELRSADFERMSSALLDELRRTSGLVATASDVLEEFGWNLGVPASELPPRQGIISGPVVGQAITLRYLPCRRQPDRWRESGGSRLAHLTALETAGEGDVLVIEMAGLHGVSAFGGLAAQALKDRGLSGLVIDGGVRDLDQIAMTELPVWTRYVTPISGKYRAEAMGINVSVSVGGVQVEAGDVVLADCTGVCFVPTRLFSEVAARILEVSTSEFQQLTQ